MFLTPSKDRSAPVPLVVFSATPADERAGADDTFEETDACDQLRESEMRNRAQMMIDEAQGMLTFLGNHLDRFLSLIIRAYAQRPVGAVHAICSAEHSWRGAIAEAEVSERSAIVWLDGIEMRRSPVPVYEEALSLSEDEPISVATLEFGECPIVPPSTFSCPPNHRQFVEAFNSRPSDYDSMLERFLETIQYIRDSGEEVLREHQSEINSVHLPDGSVLSGSFLDGALHGFGTVVTKSEAFEGYYQHNMRHGLGICKRGETKWIGLWEEDSLSGTVVISRKSSHIHAELWEGNKFVKVLWTLRRLSQP
jgi:hypothetical protein